MNRTEMPEGRMVSGRKSSTPRRRRWLPGRAGDGPAVDAVERRGFLKLSLLALGSWASWGWLEGLPVWAAGQAYPQTIAALQYARERELQAHQRYVDFAAKASTEGYKGIAYLFTAFAASEQIHARNFERILEALGSSGGSTPRPIPLSDTKDNLIAAANDEIDTIDNLYPDTLKRLAPEGNTDAITYVRYALASEKQHRDMIQKVQRYTEGFFDRVVKAIDEKTSHYYVCQVCGSTLKKRPPEICPICGSPASQYEKIDPPA